MVPCCAPGRFGNLVGVFSQRGLGTTDSEGEGEGGTEEHGLLGVVVMQLIHAARVCSIWRYMGLIGTWSEHGVVPCLPTTTTYYVGNAHVCYRAQSVVSDN